MIKKTRILHIGILCTALVSFGCSNVDSDSKEAKLQDLLRQVGSNFTSFRSSGFDNVKYVCESNNFDSFVNEKIEKSNREFVRDELHYVVDWKSTTGLNLMITNYSEIKGKLSESENKSITGAYRRIGALMSAVKPLFDGFMPERSGDIEQILLWDEQDEQSVIRVKRRGVDTLDEFVYTSNYEVKSHTVLDKKTLNMIGIHQYVYQMSGDRKYLSKVNVTAGSAQYEYKIQYGAFGSPNNLHPSRIQARYPSSEEEFVFSTLTPKQQT